MNDKLFCKPCKVDDMCNPQSPLIKHLERQVEAEKCKTRVSMLASACSTIASGCLSLALIVALSRDGHSAESHGFFQTVTPLGAATHAFTHNTFDLETPRDFDLVAGTHADYPLTGGTVHGFAPTHEFATAHGSPAVHEFDGSHEFHFTHDENARELKHPNYTNGFGTTFVSSRHPTTFGFAPDMFEHAAGVVACFSSTRALHRGHVSSSGFHTRDAYAAHYALDGSGAAFDATRIT